MDGMLGTDGFDTLRWPFGFGMLRYDVENGGPVANIMIDIFVALGTICQDRIQGLGWGKRE